MHMHIVRLTQGSSREVQLRVNTVQTVEVLVLFMVQLWLQHGHSRLRV